MQQDRFLSFFLCLCVAFTCWCSVGCHLLESHRKPRIEEAPPHLLSEEYAAMQAFHEKDRENMASQVHIARNKELERLNREIDQQNEDGEWEEDYQRTLERREKLSFWKKFKSGGDQTYLMSDEAKKIHGNLER